jgi:energy-coupling factor transporter transmembrane protein EcfT
MSPLILDPRTQLIGVVVLGVVALGLSAEASLWLILLVAGYLAIQGYGGKSLSILGASSLVYGLHVWILSSQNQTLSFFSFLTFLALRFTPVLAAGRILENVPTGKLMIAFQKMGVSRSITITLAVALRFFSVLREESKAIQITARLRGVSLTSPRNWLHLLRNFEYTFVPLMMRTLRISDELSAAAATKGIDYPYPRTSLYSLRFGSADLGIGLYLVLGILGIIIFPGVYQ